jgi:iron complex transport system substrate-binding protein
MQEVRNDIMNRPGWDHIDAVRDGRVYIISTDTRSIHPSVWHSYVARWFHPELFEDVDPEAIHREWIETFLGVEYRGVYAYPAYPVS